MNKSLLIIPILALCMLAMGGYLAPHTASYAAGDFYAYLPNVNQQFTVGHGAVEGTVVNANGGYPISDVLVCFEENCVATNASGEYTITGIPSGWRQLASTFPGFSPSSQIANVVADKITTLNFTLSEDLALGEYRIVLTWDVVPYYYDPSGNPHVGGGNDIPNDMDAHLWIPDPGGPIDPLHIYWGTKENLQVSNCDAFPNACLEFDKKDGSGPESIVIIKLHQSIYTYAVQYYADYIDVNDVVPPLRASHGKVQVYDYNGLVKTYHVPTVGEGVWWHVFDVDGVNDGEIIDRNVILNDSPGPMSAPF